MSAPRLEVRLDRIGGNARILVERLGLVGIAVCGVTKATLGSPVVARELLDAGVASLGESRIENIEHLRRAGVTAPITLIRSPQMSQVDRVVASAELSLNSEIDVVAQLSVAARHQRKRHGIVLMVELGDLREGIMPGDLCDTVRCVLGFPGIDLRGVGTNLACQHGVIPDNANMAELSALAGSVEATFGIDLDIVSGGNSANLPWIFDPGADLGRINHLRLGESILLGREPIHRGAIDGLDQHAFSIVGEVIESKRKPSEPWGERGQAAFGHADALHGSRGPTNRVIVALGRHDVDTAGIVAPDGFEILGASSDHLVLVAGSDLPEVGAELRFDVNYSALMRAMASPFVSRRYLRAERTVSASS